jgi:hypothetical protein
VWGNYIRMKAIKAAKVTEHVDTVPIDEDDEALLARLEKEGLVRRGQGGPIPAELLRPGPRCKGPNVLDALTEDRRSGR